MRLQLMKLLGIILLLAGLVVGLVPGAGAKTAQTWRLLHDTYTGTAANDTTTHYKDLIMNKTGDTVESPYYMILPANKTVWWYAENVAQVNVSFGTDVNWKVHLYHETASDEKIKADIYSVNQTGGIDQLATSGWVTATSNNTKITVEGIKGKEQLIPQNSRIGLRISWTGSEASFNIYYYSTSNEKYSSLTSPETDPGYPVPELPTIILVFLGLLLLGGYIWLKRRRKSGELLSC